MQTRPHYTRLRHHVNTNLLRLTQQLHIGYLPRRPQSKYLGIQLYVSHGSTG
ncbi:hypothetical protein [Pelomicrobium methylotrophicum]|uniref:hypothetical protein n=1 Tax=Pelomicrobium methylotrophicum TaxID=2602750 RepID=UPI001969C57C|nr:hypothetical protein [Pelomicrobium methylotrophicum]